MKIPLSPMDYYFFRKNLYTIQFVFEYHGHLETTRFAENLKRTAAIFQAVGSQLKILSDNEIVFETGFPVTLQTHIIKQEPEAVITNAEIFLDSIENSEGKPLVKVLVTQTPSRSFVGFSFSHMLGDGASFFQFLDCLTKMYGTESYDSEPSNRRELLQSDSCYHVTSDALFAATGYIMPRPADPISVNVENFYYSNHKLEELKKNAIEQGVEVSRNDLIMAELAKKFHKYIPLYKEQFIVRCPVDYRKIFNLPAGYFGNAIRDAVTIFKAGEIENLDLYAVALRIRKSIQNIDRESVLRSLECLNALQKGKGNRVFEDVGCPGLLVSNLSKFPVAKINLGLGAPIGFHHASLNPRLALILPAQDGIEVRFKRPG